MLSSMGLIFSTESCDDYETQAIAIMPDQGFKVKTNRLLCSMPTW